MNGQQDGNGVDAGQLWMARGEVIAGPSNAFAAGSGLHRPRSRSRSQPRPLLLSAPGTCSQLPFSKARVVASGIGVVT